MQFSPANAFRDNRLKSPARLPQGTTKASFYVNAEWHVSSLFESLYLMKIAGGFRTVSLARACPAIKPPNGCRESISELNLKVLLNSHCLAEWKVSLSFPASSILTALNDGRANLFAGRNPTGLRLNSSTPRQWQALKLGLTERSFCTFVPE